MINYKKILFRLKQECEKSTHNRRMAAAVLKRGRIIGIGHNFLGRYTDPNAPHPFGAIHAEWSAYKDACRSIQRESDGAKFGGHCMIVARLDRWGFFRIAKPCKFCMEFLKQTGLRSVLYTKTDNPELGWEEL